MPEAFELPVSFQGKEVAFPAELVTTGFGHFILIHINNISIRFERDEEGNYRAVISVEDRDRKGLPSRSLLEAIASALQEHLG